MESKNAIKTKRKKIDKNAVQLYSMCAIPILLVIVFNYLPMFGIIIAFKDYKYSLGILASKWTGFSNFEFFLRSNDFLRLVSNTLSLNFLFIVFGTIAAMLVAILLFELKNRISTKIFQTTLIAPHFLSWVMVSYMSYAFLQPEYGLLNNFLTSVFHISPINWYAKPEAWPAILTTAAVWKGVGMDSVVYYAALMGIDTALIEAAEIDGATKKKTILHIILPSLIPLTTILILLRIGNIFRADFGLFYQLTRDVGTLYATTDVIDTYIFRAMRKLGDMGMSTAVGLLQSVVGFVLVILANYFAKKIDPDSGLF